MRLLGYFLLLSFLYTGFSAQAAFNNLQGSIQSTTFYESTLSGANDTTLITLELQTDVDYGATVNIRAVPQGSGPSYAIFDADYTCPTDFTLNFISLQNGVRIY